MTLNAETKANYENFLTSWKSEASKNWDTIHQSDRMLLSYRRISAIQGVKLDLLPKFYSSTSVSFFNEAHNDALVSHISASMGAWRLALQSLRSFIENFLCGLYYEDHPIELKNWERGKKKIGFSELMSYFESHPDIDLVPAPLDGIAILKKEYKTLSLAVHASAKEFRMTDDISEILLWSTDTGKINKWSAREESTFAGIILLLLSLHKSALTGTQMTGLRTALSYIFGSTLRAKLKSSYNITIQIPDKV